MRGKTSELSCVAVQRYFRILRNSSQMDPFGSALLYRFDKTRLAGWLALSFVPLAGVIASMGIGTLYQHRKAQVWFVGRIVL